MQHTHTMGCIWSQGEMKCTGKLADLESVLREPILMKTDTTRSLSYAEPSTCEGRGLYVMKLERVPAEQKHHR